jgi:hypothetical protein
MESQMQKPSNGAEPLIMLESVNPLLLLFYTIQVWAK